MTAADRCDDPVVDALAWRLANDRRAWLAAQAEREPEQRPAPGDRWEQCHYCPAHGVTRDHVVPQSRLPKRWHRMTSDNIVPSCRSCNERKADARSDCGCERCILAWVTYGPSDWHLLPVVAIVQRGA